MTDISERGIDAVRNLLVTLASEAMLLRHPQSGIAEAARQADNIIGQQAARIEQLEAGTPSQREVDAVREENIRLKARVDQLEAAMKALLDLEENTSPFGGEMQQDRIERTIFNARALIAKPAP